MSATESDRTSCLIGLDLGTSAVKGVVMDPNGRIVAEAERGVEFLHPQEGWVEVDPEAHYRDVCDILRELCGAAPGPVAAVAMAAASGNTLLTDADGQPLTNIINWMDQRAVLDPPHDVALPPLDEIHRVVGWPYSDRFPLAHLAWLKSKRAEVYAGAGRCCMNTDWLLFRLTGQWRMDRSTATTSYLQDQVSGTYHVPFLEALDLPESKLSPLCVSGTPLGPPVGDALARTGLNPDTQIIAGCFDHPGAARAFGVLAPGQLMLSCGTSWVGFFPEPDRSQVIDAGLLCDPFLSDRGGPWGAIFSVPYIGRTIDWYVEHVIAPDAADRYAVFNEAAAAAPSGADGLRIDLRDEGHAVQGSIENISRAVMEGAANLLNNLVAGLRKRGIGFEEAVMVGGPTNSSVWPGIVEEITGIRLKIGTRHAGAKGAAMLAGIGAGWYADEEEAFRRAGDGE